MASRKFWVASRITPSSEKWMTAWTLLRAAIWPSRSARTLSSSWAGSARAAAERVMVGFLGGSGRDGGRGKGEDLVDIEGEHQLALQPVETEAEAAPGFGERGRQGFEGGGGQPQHVADIVHQER